MADRICSLCGEMYTDDKGHDYNKCVQECERLLQLRIQHAKIATQLVEETYIHLKEAEKVSKQDWWKEKLKA